MKTIEISIDDLRNLLYNKCKLEYIESHGGWLLENEIEVQQNVDKLLVNYFTNSIQVR